MAKGKNDFMKKLVDTQYQEQKRKLDRVMIRRGGEIWKAENKRRQASSKFDTDYFLRNGNMTREEAKVEATRYSRMFRNAQSSLGKDIKLANKMLQSTSLTQEERENVSLRLRQMENIRRRMRQSNKGEDGLRSYNSTSVRKQALEEYREVQGAYNVRESKKVRLDFGFSKGESNFKKRVLAKEGVTNIDDLAGVPGYQDLLEDFYNAIKSYESDSARQIARKLQRMRDDYYATKITGNANQGN